MPTCTHTGRCMPIPLYPGQYELLVFVFLSNLMINLMYNIKRNCTLTASTSSEFKNDFDKTR